MIFRFNVVFLRQSYMLKQAMSTPYIENIVMFKVYVLEK